MADADLYTLMDEKALAPTALKLHALIEEAHRVASFVTGSGSAPPGSPASYIDATVLFASWASVTAGLYAATPPQPGTTLPPQLRFVEETLTKMLTVVQQLRHGQAGPRPTQAPRPTQKRGTQGRPWPGRR